MKRVVVMEQVGLGEWNERSAEGEWSGCGRRNEAGRLLRLFQRQGDAYRKERSVENSRFFIPFREWYIVSL